MIDGSESNESDDEITNSEIMICTVFVGLAIYVNPLPRLFNDCNNSNGDLFRKQKLR